MNRKHCWLCGAGFASSKDELEPELCASCNQQPLAVKAVQTLGRDFKGEMQRKLFEILEWHMAKFHRNQAMVNDIMEAMPVLARLQQGIERSGR